LAIQKESLKHGERKAISNPRGNKHKGVWGGRTTSVTTISFILLVTYVAREGTECNICRGNGYYSYTVPITIIVFFLSQSPASEDGSYRSI